MKTGQPEINKIQQYISQSFLTMNRYTQDSETSIEKKTSSKHKIASPPQQIYHYPGAYQLQNQSKLIPKYQQPRNRTPSRSNPLKSLNNLPQGKPHNYYPTNEKKAIQKRPPMQPKGAQNYPPPTSRYPYNPNPMQVNHSHRRKRTERRRCQQNSMKGTQKYSFREQKKIEVQQASQNTTNLQEQDQRQVPNNIKETIENSSKIRQDGSIPIKLVLTGDACVGKTSMLISYTSNQFNEEHMPTIFDNYVADVKCDNKKIKLWLWDTAGQQEYQKLRLLSYQKADIFLICFSLIDEDSFLNALGKWLPEVEEECPKAFKIFVGTKNDKYAQYLEDPDKRPYAIPIRKIQRELSERKIEFMSCNSLTQTGLNQVFTTAIQKVIKKVDKKKQKPKDTPQCQLI